MSTNEYGMTTERDPGADYCLQCHGSWSEAYEREKAARQQHARDNEPPTREMFERLGAVLDRFHVLTLKTIEWHAECHCPLWDTIQLDTIAKLRAACLLLGIETEGVL